MRRILLIVTVTAVTLAGSALAGPALVANAANGAGASLSDSQVQQVRQNCTQAQSVLQRLQSTDVATRVNRGRVYENLLNNLISPFDSRVSLNHYDASTLTTITSGLNQKFTAFKNDYSSYEDAFSKVLSIKCRSDPRGFYDQLATARDARTKVASDITDLNTLTSQYTDAFNDLKTSVEAR